jgi:hypothetical protein
MAGLAIFALGGRPFENGYDIRIDPSEREALNFISQLPKNVLTAGWPNGLVDNISLFSRRRVLLSRKTHVAFHETYMREMRPKAYAIIDAWFSADDRSLEFLRNHYGVSHFVIDKARRADRSLLYFEPFNQYILTKRADSEGKRRWIDAPPRQSVLFENEGYIITDLRRLASTDH